MALLRLTTILAKIAALVSLTVSSPITPYLDNVGTINGKVYLADRTEPVSASLAQQRCHQNNAVLGKIESAEENQLIRNFMLTNNIAYFVLDGADYPQEGEWYWVSSGARINYTNWAAGEPKLGRAGNCLVIAHTGGWYDGYCYFLQSIFRTLCQIGG